jgi:uncharacterized damage-inducible protein DinB
VLAEVIQTLYGYSQWATGRVLDAAAHLSPEQLHAPGDAGRGSIRDTLLHMFSTQRGWLSWWDGSLPPADAYRRRLDPADFPDVAALRAAWEALERQTQAFTAGLTDEQAARVYSNQQSGDAAFAMPLWQMMLHVANHNTQHRAEVAAQLTRFGHSPGDLDLLFYFPTTGQG